MKKMKFKSLVYAVAALIFALPTVIVPAFANSGPPWEEGVTPTGVHCVHENSVLQVQSEQLTFNIGTPPRELKEGEKYDTTVTAEYVFYNSTADTVNTKMAFPIGLMPYYELPNDSLKKIENPITVNGQPVEYTVRHTYGRYNDFAEDVKKIKDDYIQTDFFKLDLPVTEYVFRANLEDDKDGALFKAQLPQSANTRYFCDSDSRGLFSRYMRKADKFSIFVLGTDVDITALDWTITRYNDFLDRHTAVKGSVSLVEKMPTITFKDYVLRDYDKNNGISEIDWYNAVFDNIKTDGVCAGYHVSINKEGFTEWYVYETSVVAGGTFTNAVTANLFPTIYFEYEPNKYEYSYYLSPAKEWADFGNLTVNINTKLYMQQGVYYNPDNAQNSKFTKTDTGYTATFATLPDKELHFSMCSVQTPSTVHNGHTGTSVSYILLIVFCALVLLVPLVVGATLLIIFLVKRRKKKENKTQPLPQAVVPPMPVQEVSVSSDIDDGIVAPQPQEIVEEEPAEQPQEQPAPKEEESVFCIYCGSKLDKSSRFCTNCGGAVYNERNVPHNNPVPPVQPTYSAPNPNSGRRVNGFGIAGFVVSLVAWIFVELLSGFAFLLTAVAFGLSLAGVLLRKKYPRVYGLAIAGLVISSAMILLVIIGIFIGLLVVLGFALG